METTNTPQRINGQKSYEVADYGTHAVAINLTSQGWQYDTDKFATGAGKAGAKAAAKAAGAKIKKVNW